MARAKRRSSTQKVSPSGASTTPTSNSTPMFSSRNSVVSETPMTTEIDEEASEHVKPPPERAIARRTSAVQSLNRVPGRGRVQKRKAAMSIEPEAPIKKKRVTRTSIKSELNNIEAHSEGTEQEDMLHVVQGKGKGKGKARAQDPPPTAAESASDGSLSGEEPICEESDDSGSEFIVSDEDEEIMLDAAVRMSLQTSRLEAQNGASSSAAHNIELSLDVVRRAAAAERMVAQNHDVSDGRMIADSDLELSFSDESSDVNIVRRRGNVKGKAKSKSKSKSKLKSKIDVKAVRAAMGWGISNASELKERKALKAEEMAMSSKLCRKLTHVRT